MKIVLDTNVLVSGLLTPFSPSGEIVRQVAAGALILCYDARVLCEYEEVLRRPRFGFAPTLVADLLEQIRREGIPVAAQPLAHVLPDSDDTAFPEVALSGRAKCLVTGNLRHFPPGARAGMTVLAPREFVDRAAG